MKNTIVASLVTLILAPLAGAQCVGDIAVDGRVDGGDLGVLLANWGPVTSTALSQACDLDGNGVVNGGDLGLLLANWGACPAPTWATILEFQPDPAAVTDPDLRAAIQSTGLPWRVRDRDSGIEMLLIPPGTFQMGCIMGSNQYECDSWEQPVHPVTLTNAFYMGRYEVTQAQWQAKMGSNPSYYQPPIYTLDTNRPVEYISWDIIQDFNSATGLRLPTEAEWEYAYRAGTTTAFHSYPAQPTGFNDDTLLGNIAWFYGNAESQTHTVGGKLANGLGLHDMAGNVYEWCQDWWYGSYSSGSVTNPTGPATGSYRVMRGGSLSYVPGGCRGSKRLFNYPPSGFDNVGFRVVRNP